MVLLFNLLGRFLLLMFNPHTLPITAVRIEGDGIKTEFLVLIVTVFQVARGGFLITLTVARPAVWAWPWMTDVQVRWPESRFDTGTSRPWHTKKLVRYNNGIAVRTAKAE